MPRDPKGEKHPADVIGALGPVKRDHMPYYLRIVTAAGTAAYVSTPCASVEAAMETASPVLRYGAIDAWVADENEKKVADFEAIKKHWAVRKSID